MRILGALVFAILAAGGCLDSVGIGGGGRVEATDFVSGKDYSKWVIEVDYASGHKPSQELLDFIHGKLSPVVAKPGGIEFRYDSELGDTEREWTAQDIVSYSDSKRSAKTGGDTVVLHLLFVKGSSASDAGDRRVLGVTVGNDVIAIFVDSMDQLCDGGILPIPGTCSVPAYYRSVVLHEFGHAIGLVDNGIPMVRDHEADTCGGNPDEGHSDNDESVMSCAVESSDQLLGFQGRAPTSFDSDDLADLQAVRNG